MRVFILLFAVGCTQVDAAPRAGSRGRFRVQNVAGGATSITLTDNTYSYSPDGVDEFATCGDPTIFDGATTITWESWLYHDTAPSAAQRAFWSKNDVSNRQFDFRLHVSGGVNAGLEITIGTCTSGSVCQTSGWTMSNATWYHVVVAYDGGGGATDADKLQIYVDGTSRSFSCSFNPVPATLCAVSSAPVRIGAGNAASVHYGPGNLDEFRLWDQHATQAQVTELYNAGKPVDPTLSTLGTPELWYRMGDNDTHPTIANNGSTAGFDCTAQNGETADFETNVP